MCPFLSEENRMAFLNIFMLIGLAASAIPLLIHLFHRQRVTTIDFSSILFIKHLHLHQSRALKIRQLLLLILRALIILLAVLAFARPVLEGPMVAWLGTGVHQQTAFTIILDNSYSMSAGGRVASPFTQARKAAQQILDRMQNGDEGLIVLTAVPVKALPERPTTSLDLIQTTLSKIEVSSQTGNIADALSLANALLANTTSLNKKVYILTDMQRRDWQALLDTSSAFNIDPSVTMFLYPFDAPDISNVSVDAVAVNERLLIRNQPEQVTAIFTNHSTMPIKDRAISLFVNGVKRDSRMISADPGKSGTVKFNVMINAPGRYSGYVEIDQDDILTDNRQYFNLTIPPVITVQIIGNSESRYFLEQVLEPSGTLQTPIVVQTASAGVLNDDQDNAPDVMVIDGSVNLTAIQTGNMERYLAAGGGLLLFLGSGIGRSGYENTLLNDVFSCSVRGRLGSPGQRESYLSLGQMDHEHPIFTIFQSSTDALPDAPRFYASYHLNTTEGTRVISRFTDGAPAIIEGGKGRGKAILIASDVNTNWSDLALKSMFVPLMHRSIKYLHAPETMSHKEYHAGIPVEHFIDWNTPDTPLNIVYPSGNMTSVKPIIGNQGASIIVSRTEELGVYRIQDGDGVLNEFSINPDTAESNISIMSTQQAVALFNENKPHIILSTAMSEDGLDKTLLQSQQGYEIWKSLIWLVLLLVLLETWLTRAISHKTAGESV